MELFSSIIGIVILVFLALCVYRTIISILHEKEKEAEIPVGKMTVEEIKNLLKEKLEYPFLKSIRTGENGDIEIEGKYGIHKVGIKNGKLYTYDKFKLFSNSKKKSEENRCLRFYLAKIMQPESQYNPPKIFKEFKRYIAACNVHRITEIIVCIYLVVMVIAEFGGIDELKSKGGSNIYFTDYSEEVTIGEDINFFQGMSTETLYESASGGNIGNLESALGGNEIVRIGTFWWQEGANEDARGADVTIGYDDNGDLRIVGKSWNSIDITEVNSVITAVYEDGSMVVECLDEVNEGILYIYPAEDGGIYIEQEGILGGVDYPRFNGMYQLK